MGRMTELAALEVVGGFLSATFFKGRLCLVWPGAGDCSLAVNADLSLITIIVVQGHSFLVKSHDVESISSLTQRRKILVDFPVIFS